MRVCAHIWRRFRNDELLLDAGCADANVCVFEEEVGIGITVNLWKDTASREERSGGGGAAEAERIESDRQHPSADSATAV